MSPWTPSRDDWSELLDGEPRYRLDQLWQGLYQHGQSPDTITTLPAALRDRLAATTSPALTLAASQESADGETAKWLFTMADGAAIETVLMHYRQRSTACISSQAGCAMGCGFCATGQGGYDRNLSVGEILEQVVTARARAAPRRLSNIVFMGMGEPFANHDRVLTATKRIIEDFGIGARHITISTIGLVPQILRLAEEGLQVGLAISLHAANDAKRTELIPLNKRHPLDELVSACQLYRELTGRRVTFEWAMIDEVNDTAQDVRELADLAHRTNAHVNLIRLNPTPGWPTVGSPEGRIRWFRRQLEDLRVNATIRANRGLDIEAACGQLRADNEPTPVTLSHHLPSPPERH
ncbi:MAG: 23S rRNA (adenine(2503)-C(2))-methyltransferase RlmN [Actinomycetia bacterium]|nr:23S rRNA (adenine(2503)-C(2))-methyltransferase RlmN [Actinomycetes bacterium]MCP5030381.1 23S rRNA (adenine(2503)-C(2))-methyltransferase RlmN [Actinomycetes bacterium]